MALIQTGCCFQWFMDILVTQIFSSNLRWMNGEKEVEKTIFILLNQQLIPFNCIIISADEIKW